MTAYCRLPRTQWLATYGHSLNLAVGMKNAVGLIPDLVDTFDFAINEQCMRFAECDSYGPFISNDKAVCVPSHTHTHPRHTYTRIHTGHAC